MTKNIRTKVQLYRLKVGGLGPKSWKINLHTDRGHYSERKLSTGLNISLLTSGAIFLASDTLFSRNRPNTPSTKTEPDKPILPTPETVEYDNPAPDQSYANTEMERRAAQENSEVVIG